MKAKTLIMTFALFAVMTGCSKTETSTVVTPAGNKVTLKAYVNNPATKVGFASDGTFYWSKDDKLGVLDGGGTPVFHEFKLNAGDKGKANGVFTGTFPDGTDFGAYAVYPYNENHSVSGNMLTYDFPANYNYEKVDGDYFTETQGDGNSFNAPMWGAIADGSVQMKHLGGVFCIKIADMPCTDGTLTLTSNQKISGTYTVSLSAADPVITAAATTDDAEKTVSIAFSGATEKSPGVFYVPAPVGEHDLNIKMVNGASEEQFNTHIGKYEIARRGLQRIYIVTVNGYAFEMKPVTGGTFTRGSHQVTLTKDYYIGKYEVTQGLWKKVMGEENDVRHYCTLAGRNPDTDLRGEGDNYPMYWVSHDDIVNIFLPKLNEMTSMTFTLPTEAQWEFAARGGVKSKGYKYSGSNTINDVAWYKDNGSNKTHPVGLKQPNELGIYDMSGNVWEWCLDWWADNYPTGSATDPQGPPTGSNRVGRGGGWNHYASGCTVSYRYYFSPDYRYSDFGFRLALVLP